MKQGKRMKESGSALVYILIAIALLAALTASFMQPSSQQTTSQNIVKTAADLRAQSEMIRAAIQECVLLYPGGDQSEDGVVLANNPYPLRPSDTYFDTASVDPDNISTDEVKYVRCPGNPGTTKNHARIFGIRTGKSLPVAPDLFEDWKYYSGPNGVFFYTRTGKSDAFLATALERLDDDYAECEADVINATSGNVSLLSGGGNPVCASGGTCFRVWILANASATNAYQAGSPERAANCP